MRKVPAEIAKHGITRIVHDLKGCRLDVGHTFARIFSEELLEFLQTRVSNSKTEGSSVAKKQIVKRTIKRSVKCRKSEN